MKNWSWADVLVGLFLTLILFVTPAIMVSLGIQYKQKADNEIPRIEITLNNTGLEEVNSAEKSIKFPDNKISISNRDQIDHYTGVELSGHGNSTRGPVKKPYNLKFKQRVALLGNKKAKSWVLLANAFDSTYLRNDTALYLASMLGDQYAAKGEFVELYIDGDYLGLYYMAPKITINKGSVDLKDTLGILVELDNLHSSTETCYRTHMGNCLIVKDTVGKDYLDEAMTDFLITFNRLEVAAETKNYAAIENLIDTESFARYYLISEFTSNPDAYSTSWFMYKDGVADKIHAGPVWDFDFALNNKTWGGSGLFSPEDSRTREKEVFGWGYYDDSDQYIEIPPDTNISKLMYLLLKIPEFQAKVEEVFSDNMSGRAEELMEWIQQRNSYIDKAATKDARRWETLERNNDVNKLIDWVQRRYAFFEKEYGTN